MVLCVIRVNVYLVFRHYGIIKFVKLQHCLLDKMFTKYEMCFCKKCKQFTIIDNNNCFICAGSKIFLYCHLENRATSNYTCCGCKRKFKKQDTYWIKFRITNLCA
jgi:hypothetical protein